MHSIIFAIALITLADLLLAVRFFWFAHYAKAMKMREGKEKATPKASASTSAKKRQKAK